MKVLAESLPHLQDKQLTSRMKQWLHYFSMQSPEIAQVFEVVKRELNKDIFFRALDNACTDISNTLAAQ
jgi:tRNA-dihydrouridine synthase C